MAKWKLDRSALKVAIAREIERQGVRGEVASEVSPEQMRSIDDAAESIAWAFSTEFERHREGGKA